MLDMRTILKTKRGIDLTETEWRVLCVWFERRTAKESAKILKSHYKTIEWHRANVKSKFGVSIYNELRDAIETLGLKSSCSSYGDFFINEYNKEKRYVAYSGSIAISH